MTYEDISDTSHLTVAEIEQLAKKIKADAHGFMNIPDGVEDGDLPFN